jgi:hypothetical protein
MSDPSARSQMVTVSSMNYALAHPGFVVPMGDSNSNLAACRDGDIQHSNNRLPHK